MRQGKGMLQSRRELFVLGDYEEAFGLRELRAKVNAKAGFTPDESGMQAIRLAICADQCYGSRAVEISRKYLDSGPLSKEFLSSFIDDKKYRNGDMAVKLVTLAAGTMTLGCTLPPVVKETLKTLVKSKNPNAFRNPYARSQMEKAVSSYIDGTPYNFGNKSMYESQIGSFMVGGKTSLENVGNQKVVKLTSNGMTVPQIIGPPTDEEIGVPPIHPYDVCAACGTDTGKENDGKLLRCGKCRERKYCSPACQKKHWKLHKPICSREKVEMDAFMDSIPLDWTGEAKPNFAELLGDSDVVVSTGQGTSANVGR